MTLKDFVRDFCDFSRRDRIAILSLIILCFVVWWLPSLFSNKKNQVVYSDSMVSHAIQKLHHSDSIRLFFFDPNIISTDRWKELGIRERTIQTIQKYTSKGGRFRKKEDLQRIYGLSEQDYQRIAPYVVIAQQKFVPRIDTGSRPVYKKYSAPSFPVIDINLADTTAFIALPGIGSKLAARIILFREKLGGFYAVEQIAEVYGLADSTFQKIRKWMKVDDPSLKKININTATNEELKAHPYIRWNIANAIVAYRNEHGKFESAEDLKKIMIITNEIFTRLQPYIEY